MDTGFHAFAKPVRRAKEGPKRSCTNEKFRQTESAARDGKEGEESAEERLIARYFRPLAKHPGAFGLADDAAAITPPAGCDLVLTTDGVIAGVHFLPDDAPRDVAARRCA